MVPDVTRGRLSSPELTSRAAPAQRETGHVAEPGGPNAGFKWLKCGIGEAIWATTKRRGLIPAARPIIAQVRTRGGLWLTDKLVEEVLERLDE